MKGFLCLWFRSLKHSSLLVWNLHYDDAQFWLIDSLFCFSRSLASRASPLEESMAQASHPTNFSFFKLVPSGFAHCLLCPISNLSLHKCTDLAVGFCQSHDCLCSLFELLRLPFLPCLCCFVALEFLIIFPPKHLIYIAHFSGEIPIGLHTDWTEKGIMRMCCFGVIPICTCCKSVKAPFRSRRSPVGWMSWTLLQWSLI